MPAFATACREGQRRGWGWKDASRRPSRSPETTSTGQADVPAAGAVRPAQEGGSHGARSGDTRMINNPIHWRPGCAIGPTGTEDRRYPTRPPLRVSKTPGKIFSAVRGSRSCRRCRLTGWWSERLLRIAHAASKRDASEVAIQWWWLWRTVLCPRAALASAVPRLEVPIFGSARFQASRFRFHFSFRTGFGSCPAFASKPVFASTRPTAVACGDEYDALVRPSKQADPSACTNYVSRQNLPVSRCMTPPARSRSQPCTIRARDRASLRTRASDGAIEPARRVRRAGVRAACARCRRRGLPREGRPARRRAEKTRGKTWSAKPARRRSRVE